MSIRIAIIAGERSGDLLGADLIAAIAARLETRPELVGVGGPALASQGLVSLFDYSELSIMGVSAVLAKLPKLVWRIRQTADAIIAARPDCLIIVDSPDFTHRVARRVRAALPAVKIVNYVCPTVWAWKPERAPAMRAYVDHVLSILPFEPEIVAALGGPPLTYVGHRLTADPGLLAARAAQAERRNRASAEGRLCLLLPGSRGGEIKRLAARLGKAAEILRARDPSMRFVLPAAPGREEMVRAHVATWQVPVEIVTGDAAKWQAFGAADVAIAASGTVLLELALAGIPVVSIYQIDMLAYLLVHKITTWSAALPNLIVDRVVVPEYFNSSLRPGLVARAAHQFATPGAWRDRVLSDLDQVWDLMQTERPPSELGADTVLSLLK